MTIHVVGDRRNTGFCIKCGADLQIPWNDFQCCTECTKKLEYLVKVTKGRKEKVRKLDKKVVLKQTVMRQRKPIQQISIFPSSHCLNIIPPLVKGGFLPPVGLG